MSGLFLSFEGGEASGKSVQAKRLATWLEQSGHDVVLTREPGGTTFGERIRELLLQEREVPMVAEVEALLFNAARAQLVREVIRPAVAAGRVVIADRFFDSTLAYQGYGRGADRAGLEAITRFVVGDTRPQRTYLLDVPVDIARTRRAADPRDRFEMSGRDFHDRLREGYLALASADPARIRVVNGARDEQAVALEIQRDVEGLLVPSAR